MEPKTYIIFIFILCSICVVHSNAPTTRSSRRIHIPALGIGPRCTGCPEHFCDDDPAIIHGYCCGCARFFDSLPVKCSKFLKCPLNEYDLCQNYEYMMHCCCSK